MQNANLIAPMKKGIPQHLDGCPATTDRLSPRTVPDRQTPDFQSNSALRFALAAE
jgi:hypothetical protein